VNSFGWSKRWLVFTASALLIFSACGSSATPSPSAQLAAPASAAPPASGAAALGDSSPTSPYAPVAPTNVRICYTTNLGDPYSTALANLITYEASLYGYKVDVFDIHNDIPTQLTDLQNCVTQKYTAIVMQPYDATALCPAIKAAHDAGVAMVEIEMTPTCPQYLPTLITDDPTLEGQGAAQLMAKALNGNGNVVVVQGLLNNPVVPGRTNGFTQFLAANAPGIKVIGMGVGAWNTATSQTLTNTFLTRFGASDIQGVYAEDSGMAFGVINALQAQNLTGKIAVVSINGTKQEYADIKAGTLYGTVLNDASFVAVNAVQRIRDLLEHRPIEPEYKMPASTIDKSNVNNFVGWF
jgi:ABC-type sugar transport system substrate-binding protein